MSKNKNTIKFFNCRFCFSFLENREKAENHLEKFHRQNYEQIRDISSANRFSKRNNIATTEQRTTRFDINLAFIEFSTTQPVVLLENCELPPSTVVPTERPKAKTDGLQSKGKCLPLMNDKSPLNEIQPGGRKRRKCKDTAKSRISSLISKIRENDSDSDTNIREDKEPQRNRKKRYNTHQEEESTATDYVASFKRKSGRPSGTTAAPNQLEKIKEQGYQECPICNKFYKPSSFAYHLRRHRLAEELEIKRSSEIDSTNSPHVMSDPPINSMALRTKPFTCKICLKFFENEKSYLHHSVKAHGEHPVSYSCLVCRSPEISIAYLVFHMRVNHPEVFEDKSATANENAPEICLSKRTRRRQYENKFTCEKCQKGFPWISLYRKHLLLHTRTEKLSMKKQFHCTICDKYFTRQDGLKRHSRFHMANNPLVCTFPGCNRACDAADKLRRHMALHYSNDNDRVQCKQCPANFTRQDRLNRHIQIHHGSSNSNASSKPLNIRRRWSRVTKAADLLQALKAESSTSAPDQIFQVKTEEGMNDELFRIRTVQLPSIDLVDKIILDESGKSTHIKGEKLDAPTESGSAQVYTTIGDSKAPEKMEWKSALVRQISSVKQQLQERLQEHQFEGEGKRIFKCDECGISYIRSWLLRMHFKTAHGRVIKDGKGIGEGNSRVENAIQLLCGTCGYLAKSPKDLESHMASAPKHGKKYACRVCGRGFKVLDKLEKHEKVHFEEKKYKCSKCNRRFVRPGSLKTHLLRVHENGDARRMKVNCKVCNKIFAVSYISTHMLSVHPDNPDTNSPVCVSKPQCKLCNDTFTTSMSLRRHIQLVHLGKPVPMWVNGKKTFSSGSIRNRLFTKSQTEACSENNNGISVQSREETDGRNNREETVTILGI